MTPTRNLRVSNAHSLAPPPLLPCGFPGCNHAFKSSKGLTYHTRAKHLGSSNEAAPAPAPNFMHDMQMFLTGGSQSPSSSTDHAQSPLENEDIQMASPIASTSHDTPLPPIYSPLFNDYNFDYEYEHDSDNHHEPRFWHVSWQSTPGLDGEEDSHSEIPDAGGDCDNQGRGAQSA